MKNLKCRAWNYILKIMDADLFMSLDGKELYDYAEQTYDTPNLEIEVTGNFKNMLFTGKQDDFKADIYEFDFLQTIESNEMDEFIENILVFWDYDKCGFFIKYLSNGECFNMSELPSCKVIGNIYKNPEMLGDYYDEFIKCTE